MSVHVPARAISHNSSPDVLSEPDDSYPIREPKKLSKARNAEPSRGIGAFFSRPSALTVHSEDIVMNEGEAPTEGAEA